MEAADDLLAPRKVHARMLCRFEYEVETSASPDLCWQVFSDQDNWNRFVPCTYAWIKWTEGQPWKVRSRMKMELLHPMPTVVDQLIIGCTPPYRVGWVNHVMAADMPMGDTIEQWVSFYTAARGGTRVATWLEICGTTTTRANQDMTQLVRDFKIRWYNAFARWCDGIAQQSRSAQALIES